jgi:uncharacterized repeat protein (TIGR02543 family)
MQTILNCGYASFSSVYCVLRAKLGLCLFLLLGFCMLLVNASGQVTIRNLAIRNASGTDITDSLKVGDEVTSFSAFIDNSVMINVTWSIDNTDVASNTMGPSSGTRRVSVSPPMVMTAGDHSLTVAAWWWGGGGMQFSMPMRFFTVRGVPIVVSFDAQGGTAPSPASTTVTNGLTYGPLATTTRTGYAFGGWWTGTGGTGTEVTSATTVTITAAQTLYAKWTDIARDILVVRTDGVGTTGWGTLSPNYSNAVLEIGKSYTMTAKPPSGFAFTNWTTCAGEVLTNNPMIRFVMQSNLCLQANFVDAGKPTLVVTAPTANQRWSNAVFTVKGTAKDNAAVTGVWCQTNGAWGPANLGGGGNNWAIDVTLFPGTNTVRAYAVDAAGNKSLTNSVNLVYVISDRLVVQATEPCTLSPNYSNTVLEIGKSYSTIATPGHGLVLSNWVGTVLGNVVIVTNTPKLTFTMQSNLVLQANIIPNPFIPIKGAYNGLFSGPDRAQESSGFFTLTLTDKGSYSGSLKQGIKAYPLSGQFDVAGNANSKVLRPGTNAWHLTMASDFAAQTLTGTISNGVSGGWVAGLWANRAKFDTRTNPATQYAGKYTLIFPGTTNQDGTVALGDGYVTLSVLSNGQATLSGSLADSTNFSQTVSVSQDGQLPTYASLYSGKGSVWGWLLFDTNQPSAALSGFLNWIKPAQAGARYYSGGFTNDAEAVGLRYTPPAGITNRVMNLTSGVVSFEGGNLTGPFANEVMLTLSNKFVNASSNKLTMTLSLPNGTFSGSVQIPGTTQNTSFKGAVLQGYTEGYGYFMGTNQSGRVFLGQDQ